MFDFLKDIVQGLKDYGAPVVPNFRPLAKKTIVPAEVYNISDRWKGIVIHHSATVDGEGDDWAAIRKYHMSYRIDGDIVDQATFNSRQMLGHGTVFEKPWSDIGYHGGWEMENGVYVFKIGRSWNRAGAHAGLKGNNSFNEQYLGFCAVGDWDKTPPPAELWSLATATVREVCETLQIPKGNVIGHREVYDLAGVKRQKTCPGTLFDMGKFRGDI
jgi:hypothetical protein